jgi:2,3-bisphosphoglycerate-dependent phosphoglycerate mutase
MDLRINELEENLNPIEHYYLGRPGRNPQAQQAVAKQGKAQ